jgi:hypothetical protein
MLSRNVLWLPLSALAAVTVTFMPGCGQDGASAITASSGSSVPDVADQADPLPQDSATACTLSVSGMT